MVTRAKYLQLTGCVVGLLATLALAGCDPGGGTGGGGSGPDTGSGVDETYETQTDETYVPPANETYGPVTVAPAPAPEYECPFALDGYTFYPYTGLTPDDAEIYEDVPYCSDGERATLENKSDGIWVIDASIVDSTARSSAESDFFRFTVSGAGGAELQNLVLVAPGDIINVHPSETILWAPHYELSTAWQIQEIGVGRLKGYGAEYVDNTLGKRTNHSGAIAECTLKTYEAVKSAAEIDVSSNSVDHAQAGLKAVSAGTCPVATDEADNAARAERAAQPGQVVDDLPPASSSFTRRVHELSGQLDEGIDIAKVIARAPKVCVNVKVHLCL
ncbi:hypothetical protein ACX80J_14565 [Arthrobacter sp. MDB2-24]